MKAVENLRKSVSELFEQAGSEHRNSASGINAVYDIENPLRAELFGPEQLNLTTKTGRPISRDYIVRYALKGWSKHFGSIERREKK